MNSLVAYNSGSSSDDSSSDEEEVKKTSEIDETNLHLKKPSTSTSVLSTSTVSNPFRYCVFSVPSDGKS